MKRNSVVRSLALFTLLSLASVGAVMAQTADPAATVAPSKPAAATATPAPGAAVNSVPAVTAEKPVKATTHTAEEKAARKKERLEKYDTNKDGKLDKKERAAMRSAKGLPPEGEKIKE